MNKGGGTDNSSCLSLQQMLLFYLFPVIDSSRGFCFSCATHKPSRSFLSVSHTALYLYHILLSQKLQFLRFRKKTLKILSFPQSISFFLPDNRRAGNTICLKRRTTELSWMIKSVKRAMLPGHTNFGLAKCKEIKSVRLVETAIHGIMTNIQKNDPQRRHNTTILQQISRQLICV